MAHTPYSMTISRLTVDKLGVKLYDRISAVIAEIVANSYDADATEVTVRAPMGETLASKVGGVITDKGFTIEVIDNGSGMTPDVINAFYLKVGAERRRDALRGDVSPKFKRKVMGRKGVGKLAPFGVCRFVEVISSGGPFVTDKDGSGSAISGHRTAHLKLDRDEILSDTDDAYKPKVGSLDDTLQPNPGTTIRLSVFDYRRVPQIEDFERQLAQRFGVQSPNWRIVLSDNTKAATDPGHTRSVGDFAIMTMPGTKVLFEQVPGQVDAWRTIGPDSGEMTNELSPGFKHEGQFYPITGWVGYSEKPYKDDLMAGVRIYCRGKIAAQTNIFNMKAGFTGEYDVRSYLVGELQADWLDTDDDLIRTDRQDILWSHSLAQTFETWGQALVKKIGTLTRAPQRKRAWDRFKEVSDIETKIRKAFPLADQGDLRDSTLVIAKQIAQTTAPENFEDADQVDSIVNLSMLLGPHISLDQKLREAADDKHDALSVVTIILKAARIAELSAFGIIAEDRVKVIKRVETLKDEPATLEAAFQNLIEGAPWLIDPQWSPVTANQSFETLKSEFQKFYKKETGKDLVLEPFAIGEKRADFVLSNNDRRLEIIEIKRPNHGLMNDEMERINTYVELMSKFLNAPGNTEFKADFPEFHVTLVCDKISLSGVHRRAFDGLESDGRLTHMTWASFLKRTRKMHEDFLREAEKQKKNAAKQ